MTDLAIRAHGETHPGRVRSTNEDCFLIDNELRLFAVFDGVGGHHAGDVASAMARDVLHRHVREAAGRNGVAPTADEVVAGLQEACAAVHEEARRRRDRRGMGTTVALGLFVAADRVMLAHVGDSRIYLLREGHLRQLTDDHTVVAELLAKNAISPNEALRHPYRNVLSRNLGGQPETRPAVQTLDVRLGDRLLLCSDGLTGYASPDAICQVVSGDGSVTEAARDLIELALKGGGGDNVTALVVHVGERKLPRRTFIVRTTGASAWWSRRDLFIAEATRRGLPESPLCEVLSRDEALSIVGGNLFEALFHDLEQTTGVHVWTYAENLVGGWFAQDGDYAAVRDLLDLLRAVVDAVVADIAAEDSVCGELLQVSVTRGLIVAELAVAGLLAKRLREIESKIAGANAERRWPEVFTEQPTVPYQLPKADPPPPDVVGCLERALHVARQRLQGEPQPDESGVMEQCLVRAHRAAVDHGGVLDGAMAAREMFDQRTLGEASIAPLLDSIERARCIHLEALKATDAGTEVQSVAIRRITVAHRLLASGTARVVVEAGFPIRHQLREAMDRTAALRRRVEQNEQRLTRMERQDDPTGVGATGEPAVRDDLVNRISVLRDEVLDTVERGEENPRGAEIFAAIVRALAVHGETDPGIDLALHDALSRRLAWGDDELTLLAESDAVCERMLKATKRSLRDPKEETIVVEAVAEVGCTAARVIAMAAIGRAGRDRAAALREDALQKKLSEALARQEDELNRLAETF